MSRAMIRWTMAGALPLAGLGVVGGVDTAAATADAATSVSPYAGTYFGYVPGSSGDYTITVSAKGKRSARRGEDRLGTAVNSPEPS